MQGAPLAGAGFTAAAVAGYGLYDNGRGLPDDIPRDPSGQRSFLGAQLLLGAGMTSAYDSFHRSLRLLQSTGKYDFASEHESVQDLFTAPFDPSFLSRWTTWLDLAQTATIATIIALTETAPGRQYVPFREHDAAFVAGLAYGAGVAEEAMFRGWLLPLFYQSLDRRFWLANALQGALFGGLHPQAGAFATVIAGWAVYEGWLTRRNGWSIRESIFHHFWYDAVVGTVGFLTEEQTTLVLTLPPIRF